MPDATRDRASRRVGLLLFGLGLIVLASVLLLHIKTYFFLTDDSFISFRYARNLAEGHGLVFNPGDDPVEGYTNFLWVLGLAFFARIGVAPETVAPMLSILLTVLLWLGATRIGWRALPQPKRIGLALLVPLTLAVNRSFAVWATSGLETRLWECLVLGALLLTWLEARRSLQGGNRGFPLAGLIWALATFTRPEALVMGAGALLARAAVLFRARRLTWRLVMLDALAFAAPVLAHLAWRLAYYGYPLPNTYYAKVGGTFEGWDGLLYVAMFVVEYALLLWVPFWIAGVRESRNQRGLWPILVSAFGPFVVFVIYAGGDHFEFRPLDVLIVPMALLLQAAVGWGVAHARSARSAWGAPAAALVVIGASSVLPSLSHRHFPTELPYSGYPGKAPEDEATRPTLVRIEQAPAPLRLPGFRTWLDSFNWLADRLTGHYAAVRQEEHRNFWHEAVAVAFEYRDLVAGGVLPEDTRIAIDCVGAIPYYSRLWTLDRLGLCDPVIARRPRRPGDRAIGHERAVHPRYLRMKGVDLDIPHPFRIVRDDHVVLAMRTKTKNRNPNAPFYVFTVAPDRNLLVRFPLNVKYSLARFPNTEFVHVLEWQPSASPGDAH